MTASKLYPIGFIFLSIERVRPQIALNKGRAKFTETGGS